MTKIFVSEWDAPLAKFSVFMSEDVSMKYLLGLSPVLTKKCMQSSTVLPEVLSKERLLKIV